MLLTVNDFPTGWRTTPVDNSSGKVAGKCGKPEPKPTHTAEVEADFANGSVEQLDEQLDSYPSPAAAMAAYQAGTGYTGSCTTLTSGGVALTIGQVSIPQVGDATFGVQATGTVQGFNIAVDIIYTLQGRLIVSIMHVDLAPLDTDLEVAQLKKAVAKVSST